MSDRYVRVYYTIRTDEKFAEVYANNGLLATWLRLLMIADEAYPEAAHLPAGSQRRLVDKLAEVGIIDTLPNGLYRIHGLDAERHRRSEPQRKAAAARWSDAQQSVRNASALRTQSGRNASKSISKSISRAEQEDRADLEAWLQVRYRLPTAAQRAFLDRYVSVFDVTGPERAARLILENPADPIDALKADLDAFREGRKAEVAAAEQRASDDRAERKRGFKPGSVEYELAQMLARETP